MEEINYNLLHPAHFGYVEPKPEGEEELKEWKSKYKEERLQWWTKFEDRLPEEGQLIITNTQFSGDPWPFEEEQIGYSTQWLEWTEVEQNRKWIYFRKRYTLGYDFSSSPAGCFVVVWGKYFKMSFLFEDLKIETKKGVLYFGKNLTISTFEGLMKENNIVL